MSEKFKPGQLVEWKNDSGSIISRCRIVEKSSEQFYYGDTSCDCWVVTILLNGKDAVLGEKNLFPVRCN